MALALSVGVLLMTVGCPKPAPPTRGTGDDSETADAADSEAGDSSDDSAADDGSDGEDLTEPPDGSFPIDDVEPVVPADDGSETTDVVEPADGLIEPADGDFVPSDAIEPGDAVEPTDEAEPTDAAETVTNEKKAKMSVEVSDFGKTADGEEVSLYTCTNEHGLVAKFITYGAICTEVITPDKAGQMANITHGFDNIAGYEGDHPYFGSTVGRYANRIAGGKFTLEGKEYTLATNNGENHLHGGEKGFNRQMWEAEPIENEDGVGVKFHRISKDGEEGYPGNLDVTATYILNNKDELVMKFTATTDAPTVLNIVNHNYWNLAGTNSGTIYDHVLKLNASKYVEPNDALIPTGELLPVADTPLDFTAAKPIGQDLKKIEADPVGYDHCYVIDGAEPGKMVVAARVREPESGRVMTVTTDQPGIQFYSGNFLDGSEANGGHEQHTAFCLETQVYPDTPNQPDFPSATLKPGETYSHTVIHAFRVEAE